MAPLQAPTPLHFLPAVTEPLSPRLLRTLAPTALPTSLPAAPAARLIPRCPCRRPPPQCDDDSYVQVDRLVAHLATLPRERLHWGLISNPGGKPIRWKPSKG